MTVYPTVEQILAAHKRIVTITGEDQAVRNVDAVRTSIELMQASYFGQEVYPSLAEKAAYLCFSLNKSHPFANGNKRTAWVAMANFLRMNRRYVKATVDERELVLMRLADGKIEQGEFTDWGASLPGKPLAGVVRSHSDHPRSALRACRSAATPRASSSSGSNSRHRSSVGLRMAIQAR